MRQISAFKGMNLWFFPRYFLVLDLTQKNYCFQERVLCYPGFRYNENELSSKKKVDQRHIHPSAQCVIMLYVLV